MPKWGVRLAVRDVPSLQPRPVRMGTLNSMPRVKRVSRSLYVQNPCNNSLKGPYVICCKGKFLSLSNIPSFSRGSPNFPDHHLYYKTYLLYLLLACSRPEHACNICHWTFSNQQSVNQSNIQEVFARTLNKQYSINQRIDTLTSKSRYLNDFQNNLRLAGDK